ncbi:MAG: thioredoxin domain-containing protein [Chloroflexota bacterium]|nr:thioredoxin domain-containing protein [Chloroflexota bacterium]
MPEDNATNQHDKRDASASMSRIGLNYVVIAVAFALAGLLMGRAAFAPAGDRAVTVDEAQLRAVIESVLDEYDLGETAAEAAPDRFALVDDDPYLGEEDAPIVIVEFSDFFCSFCKRHFDLTFEPILENYGQYIRYVYRDFARLTAESTPASAAAQCAFAQGKFWEFRAAFFNNASELGRDFYLKTAEDYELDIEEYTACLDEGRYIDEVEIDGFDGQIAGVRGTPGFFINGQILSGAQPYSIFERMIQRELAKAGIEYKPGAAG